MKTKEVFDELFSDVSFDAAFAKKLIYNNVEFITKKDDHKELFGGRLIGCQLVKYTGYDKNIFYNNLFDMDMETVTAAIEKISTINRSFKIARDDVNLVCFYMAHRFLSNEKLSAERRMEYAKEALNYFSYRTLVLLTSNYFVYPISEEKALTLSERLSNRYVIKKVKNWNEYCHYRSDEYLGSKFKELLIKFNKDDELPNAITDLYNRTKDTLKYIYGEFIDMMENDDVIKSKKGVVNDIEGQEVLLDKLNTPDSYFTKLEGLMVDRHSFIKKEHIDVTIDIINSVSYKQMEELLDLTLTYSFKDKESHTKVRKFFSDVLVNSIEYLRRNNLYLNGKTDVLGIMNSIVGNVLFARGTEVEINKVKADGDKLVKSVFKSSGKFVTERNCKNMRNALYIYVLLVAIVS